MKLQQTSSKYKYFALAFAIPFCLVLMVMIIGGYEPFGDRSMLYSDMYHQYYPFFVNFRRALLSGESIQFNWSVGLGMDYLALIAYYLASPLNLLCVLVPESLTLEFFSLLVPTKLGLASLFFAIFLNRLFRKNDPSIALFGSFYGLCAWALGYQWNVMWLDTFALLPLMTLGTIWLLRDKRFGLYTVTLTLSILSNYYIGFFICIFVLLLFFCYEICRCKSLSRFFADFGRIAIFTVIAIGMTAILELPAFAGLQNTQSSVNSFPTTFRLNIADEHTILGLIKAMGEVASNMGGGLEPTFKEGLPNVYCGVGTVILGFLYLTSKKIRLSEKACCLFLLLFFNASFIIRQLDYIWHGMHFTNMIPYRFSFLYSFVLLVMAYRAYLLRNKFKPWQLILAAVLSIGVFALSEDRMEWPFLAFNGGFLLLYLGVMIYNLPGRKPAEDAAEEEKKSYQDKLTQRRQVATMSLATVMAIELIANIVNFGIRFPSTGVSNYPKGTTDTEAVIEHMEQLEADTLFYRAETTHSQTLNDGALNGYSGVSTFTSSANVRVTEFMKALGYGAKNTYNRYCFEESSPVANLFLNLKYMIERDGDVEDNNYFLPVYASGAVTLLENQAYLPLGFLSNQALAKVDWTNSDHFDFQNKLFSAATGLEDNVWHMAEQYTITADKVELTTNDGGWYCAYENAESSSSITYEFTANRNGFFCLDLNVTDRNSYTVSKNGEKLYSESLSLPQMIAVSDVSVGDTIQVKLTCKSGEEGNMTVKGGILDASVFQTGYEILSASQLQLEEFSSTHIKGTISCNRNGLLYTSVPQDGNWTVYVDGVSVSPTLIGDAMIGVYLIGGEHTIEMVYENQAFSYGWKISLVCALCFVIALFVYTPAKKKKGKYQK